MSTGISMNTSIPTGTGRRNTGIPTPMSTRTRIRTSTNIPTPMRGTSRDMSTGTSPLNWNPMSMTIPATMASHTTTATKLIVIQAEQAAGQHIGPPLNFKPETEFTGNSG
jgi:hypothetical protein